MNLTYSTVLSFAHNNLLLEREGFNFYALFATGAQRKRMLYTSLFLMLFFHASQSQLLDFAHLQSIQF
jgi:hypothetical protein